MAKVQQPAVRRAFLTCCAATALVLASNAAATAHQGPPFPILMDQPAGDYSVSVWADPDIGDAQFFIIVESPTGQQPAIEPQVSMWVEPVGGRLARKTYEAQRQQLNNQVQFKASPYFDSRDMWHIGFQITAPGSRSAELTTQIESTPPGLGPWDLAIYLFPFLLLGALWAAAIVRRSRAAAAVDYRTPQSSRLAAHRAGKVSPVALVAVGLIVVVAAAVWWVQFRNRGDAAADVAEEQIVSDFFVSLAALDVEENELAVKRLDRAAPAAPLEPALWANLGLARLRLRDMDRAREALDKAIELTDESPEILLLSALHLEQSGEIELAIEQLRDIRRQWPEQIEATYQLSKLLFQLGGDEANAERLTLLADILQRLPDNVKARCDQARLAATLENREVVQSAIDMFRRETWPDEATKYLGQVEEALAADEFRKAATSLAQFENTILKTPQYQRSLLQLGETSVAAVGTPLRNFVRLTMPPAEAAPADTALRFRVEELSNPSGPVQLAMAFDTPDETKASIASLAGDALQIGEAAPVAFPGTLANTGSASIAAVDLNWDFRQDLILAGAEGCRLLLAQEDGTLLEHPLTLDELLSPAAAVWPVDFDADGDLDLLLSDLESPLRAIRNNGKLDFAVQDGFPAPANVRQLISVDIDGDGDIDLVTLDTAGEVIVWQNDRGGSYTRTVLFQQPSSAIAAGDADRDGRFDVLALHQNGAIHTSTWQMDGTWNDAELVTWTLPAEPENASVGAALLALADIDNNGGVDIIASAGHAAAIWLRDSQEGWSSLAEVPQIQISSIADANGDGLLDLVGQTQSGGAIAWNQSSADYAWQTLKTRANENPDDKRINTFGIGGRIEIRAGYLVQAALIDSPQTHFGLGKHKQTDVARIVWPNGTVQSEFEGQSGESIVAVQRLKGSCPWVFAFDGEKFAFIKDFIWRSPLGLRINAQDTAGVLQTEDWITIPGSQLAASDGRYSIRITAELWETHFFDHIRLLVVDHPIGTSAMVDERFVPSQQPRNEVLMMTQSQPLQNVTDHRGQALDDALARVDGVYADTFELGEYQGLAREHWVEFDLPEEIDISREVLIVGHGWLYPTDSSINVALAQSGIAPPMGLVLEQRDAHGNWHVLQDNLGSPAGKNKDVVLSLPRSTSLAESRRFRLRTTMEIYWDWLAFSYAAPEVTPRITSLPLDEATLRGRGYSKLLPLDRRRPDTPVYQVVSTQQRWLDLEGYYTRFGDVLELLAGVDDRYVIMNAGDEIQCEFAALEPVAEGWQRTFVLVGDGWVKDGDFNTAFSQWVLPLPTHQDADYAGPLKDLADDPVFQQHAEDWQRYHTRYVAPRSFQRGLWPWQSPQGIKSPPSKTSSRGAVR